MGTWAFEKFNKTVRRCESLINLYTELADADDQRVSKDIVRGAVVLAVAAFDAYITDVFSDKFTPFIRNNEVKEPLLRLLEEAGLNTRVALELMDMERPYRRIRTLIENYYCKYTTQKFKVIDDLFLKYDLKNFTINAARRSGKPSIWRSVELLVERRHEIAHNGDYNKHGRIKDIDEESIQNRIEDLKRLVENMDEIIINKIPW